MDGPTKILVPVDLSPFSARSLRYAAEIARVTGATVTALTVVRDVYPAFDFFPVEYVSTAIVQDWDESAGTGLTALVETERGDIEMATIIRRGDPASEIVDLATAEHFDLIVIATHGHSGLEHALLGSVTEKVVHRAPCPVLVVR